MKLKIGGIISLLIGFVLIINSSIKSITGNVIREEINLGSSFLGLIFIIIGLILFLAKESKLEKKVNLAQAVLDSGKIYERQREVKRIANKMGYSGREVKEGYQVLNYNGKPLTVIPRGRVSKGVYKNILRALSDGESNFRKVG